MKKRIFGFLLSMVLVIQMIMPGSDSQAASSADTQPVTLSGSAHVQTYADTPGKWDGETLTLGTTGQAKRLESITINFTNNTGYDGSIEYRVHRQTYGWTGWVENGSPAGTTGQAKRLEAIQIRLTGELAEHYDVRYRVHAQTYGWAQGWQYNGALAGTTGEAKRLEALEVQIVKKNETASPSVSYRVHRQSYGWENVWAKDGAVSGTTGQAKRLEGITIAVSNSPYNGSIEYRTHVQSYGWMPWVSNGEMSGTQGEYKRLEAIQIRLTGELAEHYDVYYRVHAQSYGWLGWAKNGEEAGTSGYGKRLEAIQIVLVSKGKAAPGNIGGVTSVDQKPYHDQDQEAAPAEKPVQPVAPDPQPAEHTHTWVPVTKKETTEYLVIDGKTITDRTLSFSYMGKLEPWKGDESEIGPGSADYGAFLNTVKNNNMTEYEEPVYEHIYSCNTCGYIGNWEELIYHQKISVYPEGTPLAGINHGGYATEGKRVASTIPHTVEVKSETVEIVTGYKCSCGATKQ